MSRYYSLDEVMYLDNLLQQLAIYEVSGGKMVLPKTAEEAFELQRKMFEKFNYFKGLIQSGECTLEFIKQDVLRKNGPFLQAQSNCLLDDYKEVYKREKSSTLNKKLVTKLLQSFSPELTSDEIDSILNHPVVPAKNTKKPKKKNPPSL